MLPIVLVLLAVQSAFCAPSVAVNQYNINEIAPVQDSGRLVSSYVTDGVLELYDGGETNINTLTIQQIINDLANQPDSLSQALAVSQTIAVLGELATGVAGDACESATLTDVYVNSIRTGNTASLRQALANYLARVQVNIDLIAQLAKNPTALRYTTGPAGKCVGGGRSYQYEAAWDALLNSANPYQVGLINEEYCAAKRLYGALNVRSNNVGAAVTAASIRPVTKIVVKALAPLANFLRAVITGNNVSAAAANAKAAIVKAANV